MGKKLARNAEKTRIESLQAARKERLIRAATLLERWGQADRMPDEIPIFDSEADVIFIEDQMTSEVIHGLPDESKHIARLHWAKGLSAVEIADETQLPRNDVRQKLGLVVEQVANKVLM